MTNFSPSFALECVCVAAFAVVLGCGRGDGVKERDLGRAAYEAHDLKKAEKLLAQSVECAPNDVDRLVLLAQVKLDLGEIQAAKELVTKAAATAGGDTDVMLLGAHVAWYEKDYAAAAKAFTAIAENPAFDAKVRAQGYAGLGIVENTCNNPHLARIAFLKALRLDRANASAWYHLGFLYRDGFGYLEAALEQFEIFVRLEASATPRVQKVQRNVIPDLKEKIARLAADRPGVTKRDSAACASAIAKAEALVKKGQHKKARQFYQDAIKLDPMSYPAAIGLAKAWQKTDLTKAGLGKALENYRLACTLRPSAISTYLTAGTLAARLGYHAQAVEIYSRAVAASPTSFDALDGLIRALRNVGNKTQISRAYQAYRDSLPSKRRK